MMNYELSFITGRPWVYEKHNRDHRRILRETREEIIELADESFHAPYASLVCAHVGNMVADGYLILRSTEDVLTMWVKDGLIPGITLTDGMTMRCGDELLADAYTFIFYTKDGDSFAKAATLADAAIDEVYRYGLACFAGQTVYIRFDVKRIAEDGSADYAYLFVTEFVP